MRWTLAARPRGGVQRSDFALECVPIPDCRQGEVLIRLHSVSIDPAMRGWMNEGTTYIKGVDIGAVMRAFAAGEVVDSKNEALPVGTFVGGMLGVQQYALSDGRGIEVLPARSADELPRYLGALGMPGMTAYWGLLDKGKPKHGETVLVSAAAGAVGSIVGQIARLHGCRTIGIAGGAAKCRYVQQELGFDAVIDYKMHPSLAALTAAIKHEATNGVDVYFDNVGGEILDAALANLAHGARVVICGAMSQYNNATDDGTPAPPHGPVNYMKIVTARGTMNGIIVLDYFDRTAEFRSQMQQWMDAGLLVSKEHLVHGIEQFPEALQMLFRGDNLGKLVLVVSS